MNTNETTRKPIFCECGNCGERWKVATLPIDLSAFGKIKPICPNCTEGKKIFLCNTDGPNAVTEPRTGSNA